MKKTITLYPEEQHQLEAFIRCRNSPYWLVQRSTILLKLASGTKIRPLVLELGISRNTVRLWRERWQSSESLRRGKALPEESSLAERLTEILSDRPRPGAPPTFEPEVAVQIVALACRKPEEFGRPISHWTPRELADEAIKQQIVASISHGTVASFLKGGLASTSS